MEDVIKKLKHWLTGPYSLVAGKNPVFLKRMETYLATLENKLATEQEFKEALENLELAYLQVKIDFTHIERRMIEESFAVLKKVPTLKSVSETVSKTAENVWDKGLKPAADHTVIPAAVAVKGFFTGLFGKRSK